MNILGFNSTHDASAALVREGRILCAVEEERFTRQKHHYGFPEHSIAACLEFGGISFKDVDHVAFYWNPGQGLLPFGLHVLRHLPKSLAYFDHQPGIWGRFVKLPSLFRQRYGYEGPFHFLDHHGNHLAAAFWPSPFDEAAALSIDGTGEWSTTVLAHAHSRKGIRTLARSPYPHSVGKLWEALTQYLGFRPNSGEGKVMGLAPYGRATFVDEFRRILRHAGGGRVRLDLRYFDFHYGRKRKYSDRFVRVFGPPREPESPMRERFEDIAFALQQVTEETLLDLARELHSRTGSRRLVLTGGVALNSVANGRIARESEFDEVFVQPSAGDAGAALGAALRVWHEVLRNGSRNRHRMSDAYLGPGYAAEEMEAALAESGLRYRRCDDVAAAAADRLLEGKFVGWFQGRMEYGPRALGNRSILADPRTVEMKDVLNARVKHREGFRPFAPAVLEETTDEWFETGGRTAPFMLKVFDVRPEKRDLLAAVTHVDGSARVQTVSRDQNPRYYDVIRAFGDRTGVPVLLNTSFNVRGEPIVCSPADAVRCFESTNLDVLVLGDFLATKNGG